MNELINAEAEDVFLATIMLHPERVFDITPLPLDTFTSPVRRKLWELITQLRAEGKVVDYGLVVAQGNEKLEAYAQELVQKPATDNHVTALAEELQDLYETRKLVVKAQEVINTARKTRDPNETLAAVARMMENQVPRGPVLVGDLMQLLADQPTPPVIPTGISRVDDLLDGGLRKHTMTVVGARPSIGKTTVANNMALNMAKTRTSVLLIEVEQASEEDAERMTAILGQHALRAVRRDRSLMKGVLKHYASLPLYLWDGARTIEDVVAMSYRMSYLGVQAIFVDYIQLLSTAQYYRSQVEQVTEISKALKQVAKSAGVAMVALSQLSRQSENRDDRKPRLSDLRSSGAIEQDADVVLLLHRDVENDPTTLNINIAKNRHGPIGQTDVYFDLETQTLEDTDTVLLEDLPT